MTSVRSGWWRDETGAGVAHFYDEDDPATVIAPLCAPEPFPDGQQDQWLDLCIERPDEAPRPYVDMGSAKGRACSECERALGGGK